MSDVRSINDLYSPSEVNLISEIFQIEDENFVNIANKLGLDRQSDFRFMNLSESNFSNCDLRGFDFTGADLTGCTGRNVTYDETTILDEVRAEASIFAIEVRKRIALKDNPSLIREYDKIRKSYWPDRSIWAMDAISQRSDDRNHHLSLALSLFFEENDKVVRNSILQSLAHSKKASSSRIDFLSRLILDPKSTTQTIIDAISTFGTTCRHDKRVAQFLLSLAEDPETNPGVRTEALTSLLVNEFAPNFKNRFWPLVNATQSRSIDHLFIALVTRNSFERIVVDASRGRLNFQDPIDSELVREICISIFRHNVRDGRLTTPSGVITIEQRSNLVPLVIGALNCIRELGLPLKLKTGGALSEKEIFRTE